jgi:hypothetical protein
MTEEKALTTVNEGHQVMVNIPTSHEWKVYATMAKNVAAGNNFLAKNMGGEAGIVSVMLYARELGVPPMQAIFDGFHSIQGKIEMSARLINRLLRQQGHKIEIKRLDNEGCVIYGERKDTGEKYTSEYTIEDARKAKLVKTESNWEKHPEDMVFARALSRLGRRLFPDVIGTAYVEGEIQESLGMRPKPPEGENGGNGGGEIIDIETTDQKPEPGEEKPKTPPNSEQNGGAIAETDPYATSPMPSEKKSDPEASQEVEPEITQENDPPFDGAQNTIDLEAEKTAWEGLKKGFINLRSGSSMMKWVRDNAMDLQGLKDYQKADIEAKWAKLQTKGEIDKGMSFEGWLRNNGPDKNTSTDSKDAGNPIPPEVTQVQEAFEGDTPMSTSKLITIPNDISKPLRLFAERANMQIQKEWKEHPKIDGEHLHLFVTQRIKEKKQSISVDEYCTTVTKTSTFNQMWQLFRQWLDKEYPQV